MKSLSFMRHAESDPNYIQVMISIDQQKIRFKNDKICAVHLKKNNIRYDVLFCSPALRTKQTSSYFLSANEFENHRSYL